MKRSRLLLPFLLLLILSCNPTDPAYESQEEPAPPSALTGYPETPEKTSSHFHGGLGRFSFYPLRIGNTWAYSQVFSVDGEQVSASSIERELIGKEELFGRNYVVEESRETEMSFGSTREFTTWVRLRQNRSGLYEADVPITQPPVLLSGDPDPKQRRGEIPLNGAPTLPDRVLSQVDFRNKPSGFRRVLQLNLELHQMVREAMRAFAPKIASIWTHGGPESDELTRLRYPLRRGQSWVVLDDPLFIATVERREMLSLPVGRRMAVRIRIDVEVLGPDDEVIVWFNRCGRLGFYVYIVGEILDEEGNVIGTIATEDTEVLEGLDLPGRPQCDR